MKYYKNVNGVDIELTPEEIVEFNTKKSESVADFNANNWKRTRKKAMPSTDDLINMLFESMDSGEIPKATAFYDAIKAVHLAHPKP
jgi:hypothetical protein